MSDEMSSLATLQDVLAYLISWRVGDFYARLISNLPAREDKRVPFMGVTFERGHHVLLYNNDWLQKKLAEGRVGFDEVQATIAHEAFHVILCHIARQMRLYRAYHDATEQKRFLKRSNCATDMAVNDLARQEQGGKTGTLIYRDFQVHPKSWVLPEHMNFPSGLTYEWYLSLMMDKSLCPECTIKLIARKKAGGGDKGEDSGGKGQPPGPCNHDKGEGEPYQGQHEGAHGLWVTFADEMSDAELEMAAIQVEQDAYEKLKHTKEEHQRARGTIPGFIEEQLEQMMKPPRVPWKRLLHNWVTTRRHTKPIRSLARPRKRWGMLNTTLYPGFTKDRTFRLVFGIDTSGSMSAVDITEGLVELQGISRIDSEVEVVVIEFDTQIHKEYVLKARGEVDVKVLGRGGTDFNAFFLRCVELQKRGEVDAAIVFTDGFAPAPEMKHRPAYLPVLWCLVDGGQHPCPDYGREIRRPRG